MNDYKLPSLRQAARRSKEVVIEDNLFVLPEELKTLGKGKKYFIRTHGCQANERDSETMSGILNDMGYTAAADAAEADLILINTCAIRENAEQKVLGEFGFFKEYKRRNPDLLLAMAGCMAQEEKTVEEILRKYPQVDLIFGTHNIYRLPLLLERAVRDKKRVVEVYSKQGEVIENLPASRALSHKAWVNIMYGCDKFCTYCIVPYTRGKERSRRMGEIVEEVRQLKEAGYKEVTLLGQNVNAYGLDLGMESGFAQLLEEVAKTEIPRIRFTTPHPRNFDEEAVAMLAKYPNIMPSFHLPVQSGSNRVLKAMNRSYTRETYLDLFDRIKKTVPGASFTTDIIVGFPNETEEEFLETLSLYDYCAFDNAFTFIFSPRAGTPAAKIEDLTPREVKEDRLRRLNEKVVYYAKKHNLEYQDRIVEVLTDGPSKKRSDIYAGYTKENKLVNFQGKDLRPGDLVQVKITECHNFSLNGTAIEKD